MAIRATADKKFLLKYLLIAIACLGFAGWSLYDGFIGYPAKLPRAEAYAELPADMSQAEKSKRWQAIADENGWSQGLPDSPEEIEGKIVWQFVMAAISTLVGVPLLYWYFKTRGTYVELDDGQIRASWGPEFSLDAVTGLNKQKWSKKGIARVEYESDGRSNSFRLDDFMYSREETGQILAAVEERLTPEQIIGGAPESERTPEPSVPVEGETDEITP